MRIAAVFNPATESSETFNAGFSNGTGRIVVYNESNNNLLLSWGSFSTYCPAWTAMLYCISANTVNIGWSVQSSLATASTPPISQVVIEAYDQGEAIVGTFPAPLMRQTNIGNVINTVGGTASAVQNDGNAAGAAVIEATVLGDGTSAVSITNDGKMTLGSVTHPATVTINTAFGSVTVDATGAVTIHNRLLANLINTLTGNDLTLGVETAHKIALQVNAIDVLDVSSSGLTLLSGKLIFAHGALTGASVFSGSANNGGNLVAHGLGVKPDHVSFTETNTGTDVTTFTWDPNSSDATNVKVYSSAGVTPRNFTAIAYKS